MGRFFLTCTALCFLLTLPAVAAERPLKGPEIDVLIKGNTVTGKTATGDWKQFFAANGETSYASRGETPSYGSWEVRGDKFCSQWPPEEHWSCYDVTGDLEATPKTITWISGGGKTFPGAVQDGKK